MIERAMIVSTGSSLQVTAPETGTTGAPPNLTMAAVERDHIEKVLAKTFWRIRGRHGAAKLLGLHPSTLYSRMKKLGIRRPGP